MNIKIGVGLGKYYDLVMKYYPYRIKHGIWLPRGSEMVEAIYEQFQDFLPKTGELVVDAGAWHGDFSVVCNIKYNAKVVAFEPLRGNFEKMKSLVKKNKAEVQMHNLGLSSQRGSRDMFSDNNMLSSIEYSDYLERINFAPLDEFALTPNLIKIDVEGFEIEVLEGGIETIKKYKPKIIVEAHSSALEKKVIEFLNQFGYSVKHEKDRHPGSGWMDSVVILFLSCDVNVS